MALVKLNQTLTSFLITIENIYIITLFKNFNTEPADFLSKKNKFILRLKIP